MNWKKSINLGTALYMRYVLNTEHLEHVLFKMGYSEDHDGDDIMGLHLEDKLIPEKMTGNYISIAYAGVGPHNAPGNAERFYNGNDPWDYAAMVLWEVEGEYTFPIITQREVINSNRTRAWFFDVMLEVDPGSYYQPPEEDVFAFPRLYPDAHNCLHSAITMTSLECASESFNECFTDKEYIEALYRRIKISKDER